MNNGQKTDKLAETAMEAQYLYAVELPCVVQKILALRSLPLPVDYKQMEQRGMEIKEIVNQVVDAQLTIYTKPHSRFRDLKSGN